MSVAEAATGTHDQPVNWSCDTCGVRGLVFRQHGDDAAKLQQRLQDAHLEVSPGCQNPDVRAAQAAYPD